MHSNMMMKCGIQVDSHLQGVGTHAIFMTKLDKAAKVPLPVHPLKEAMPFRAWATIDVPSGLVCTWLAGVFCPLPGVCSRLGSLGWFFPLVCGLALEV